MSSPLLNTSNMHRFVRYDARREILDSIGDMADIELFGTQVICAPYVHSGLLWNLTMGFPIEERLSLERLYELFSGNKGFVTQTESKESIYSGKVMLVVKVGSGIISQKDLDDADGDYEIAKEELKHLKSLVTDRDAIAMEEERVNRLAERRADIWGRSYEGNPLKPGDWAFTLQENTRQVSIQTPTSRPSRVLKFVGLDYVAGWPCKFVYESDIYGRIPYPDMVV